MLRRMVSAALAGAGFELRRREIAPPVSVGMNAAYLRMLGHPRTVIDVGVGFGTDALYEAFPSARLVLVEPVREFAPTLERIAASYDTVVHLCAAGEEEGETTIHVDPRDPQLSTVGRHTELTTRGRPLAEHRVQVRPLDAIMAEHPDLEPPFLLKVDAEGHELAVLRGATRTLERCETVLAEVSIAARFVGGYRFDELIGYMRETGWGVVAIVSVAHMPGEAETRFADVAFQRLAR